MQDKAQPTRRLGAKVAALAMILAGISVTTPLFALDTTVIGGHGGSSVEVDFSVLDSLPLVSTLPELLRPGLLPYARAESGRLPFRGERSRIGTPGIGSARPAPRPIAKPTRPRIAAPTVTVPTTKAAARPTRPTLATRAPTVTPKPPKIAVVTPKPPTRKPQTAPRSVSAPVTPKAKAPPKAPSIVSTPPAPAPAPPKPVQTASRAPAPAVVPTPSTATSATDSGAIQVLFDEGRSDFVDSMATPLAPLVKNLKSNEKSRVQLLAYAASVDGNASKARRLSLSRALSVRAHLMAQGIASTRMDVRALGDRTKTGPADRVDVMLLVPR